MRPSKPEALVRYEEWLRNGPPHFCWNCDNYGPKGECYKYKMNPPEEFVHTQDACPDWIAEVPF